MENRKFKLSLTPALIVLICYKSVLSEMLKRSLLMHILNPLLKDLKFLYIIIYSLHLGILNLSIPVIITYFLPLLAISFFFYTWIRFIAIILMVLTDSISHFAVLI